MISFIFSEQTQLHTMHKCHARNQNSHATHNHHEMHTFMRTARMWTATGRTPHVKAPDATQKRQQQHVARVHEEHTNPQQRAHNTADIKYGI